MSDLRTRLERLGERARPAPDAFERLERARRHRERNRRLAAGTLALLVAIAGSLAAFSAFGGSDGRVAGGEGDTFDGIWPESTYEDALAVQESVDAGERGWLWRLSVYETAWTFASRALGWSADRNMPAPQELEGGTTSVVVRTRPAPCLSPPDPSCVPRETTVELRRFGESPSGIWYVVSARSPEFLEPPVAGSQIRAGAELDLAVDLPARTERLYVAFVGLGECSGWEDDRVGFPADGTLTFVAPLLPDGHAGGCDVALVVLHGEEAAFKPPGLGDRLLEYGYRNDLYGLLAVSLRLGPQDVPETIPDVANVTCDGSDIAVDATVVSAQPDGVHIDLTTGATPVTFSVEEDLGLNGSSGTSVSSGGSEDTPSGRIILQSGPGHYRLSCSPTAEEGQTVSGAAAPLQVVDPGRFYVPAELECPGGAAYGMAPAYAEGAVGDRGDPIDVARARLTGLEGGDVVERAGYPQGAAEPVIRIVRDGVVVGQVQLFDDGNGGWLLSSLEACGSGGQFGWSADSAEGPSGPTGSECLSTTELTVAVENSEFSWLFGCTTAPAGESMTITLLNRDASGHNISIYPKGASEPVFRGDVCFGPDQITYSVPPLDAGTYRLVDDVQPTTGELRLIVE